MINLKKTEWWKKRLCWKNQKSDSNTDHTDVKQLRRHCENGANIFKNLSVFSKITENKCNI